MINRLVSGNEKFGVINKEYCEYVKKEISILILNEWKNNNEKILD